ncbi:MAG: homocysteine S-methyltransferase family protein [Bacteroidales bacterium]|nr:homocysteine S-methyltransferase family protein [Bacteroidales bacterium]
MLQKLGKEVMIFDGAFGTELEKRGIMTKMPELLNITHKDQIAEIHKGYIDAGCDFITTNTFGANRIKMPDEDRKLVIESAIELAKRHRTTQYVMCDIGPLGKMLYPMGELSFDEAYEAFKEIVLIAKDLVDGFILETFTDLYELKCALLAVKENCNKPVFTTMTFDATGHTLTGTSPRIMAELMSNMGADAIGVNCSLGPKDLKPIVAEFLQYCNKPVLVQPNRGIPTLRCGRAVYNLTTEEFASVMHGFCDDGVAILGGCCGTNPDFIRAIAANKGKAVPKREVVKQTVVTSATRLVVLDKVQICGERINPTGKKKLKEAIINGDFDYIFKEAIKQEEAGANLLDVNMGVPKTDDVTNMKNVVVRLNEITNLPLQIDSSNPKAIEAGCRYYNGVPLINSVNGNADSMATIFPIAQRYGAVVLGLTMDDAGIPQTAEERFAIAERILANADKHGVGRHRMMMDTLTLTCSAQQPLIKETLRALRMVTQRLGVKTALGVSNVSFGMPNRELINSTFLVMALENGLTMPIINPCNAAMTNAILAFNALRGESADLDNFVNNAVAQETAALAAAPTQMTLGDAVRRGLKEDSVALTQEALQTQDPMTIINETLIPTLNEVGSDFEKQKIFLPQLISASEACKEAFEIIKTRFSKEGAQKGTVVLATVKGDVHDIGKNIVKVIFESYGYRVIDLGKDTPKEVIRDAFFEHHPDVIGLSALMTTTVISMEETIEYLKSEGVTCPIYVGGAVLNQQLANEIHADGYTKVALEFVEAMEKRGEKQQ